MADAAPFRQVRPNDRRDSIAADRSEERAFVSVLGESVVLDTPSGQLGIAGTVGFGGGFPGATCADFGEREMKSFVARSRRLADSLRSALEKLRPTDLAVPRRSSCRVDRMPWTADDIPDQSGRTAVVTGANSGLGLETARELARHGARVVMATRNQERAAEARQDIFGDVPDADLEVRELDLASLDSVRRCAEGILDDHERVDLLVNNAGLMGIPPRTTDDGFEMQVGVNHLGHFALTGRLLPALLRAPGARVVSITSFGRYIGRPLDPDDPHRRDRRYEPWLVYGDSKLANLHFAVELDRRFRRAAADAQSLAAHPGLSHTDLQARSVRETGGGLMQRFWHAGARTLGMQPDRGALPQLRAATDPRAEGGELYGPRWVSFGPPVKRPVLRSSDQALRTLWEVSERETGVTIDVEAAMRGSSA